MKFGIDTVFNDSRLCDEQHTRFIISLFVIAINEDENSFRLDKVVLQTITNGRGQMLKIRLFFFKNKKVLEQLQKERIWKSNQP